jgi:polyisoprenyl-phosphate glycosyltransferase
MNYDYKISVVVPVFNSAETIAELVKRITDTLSNVASFEIILVNDGSTDDSWQEILNQKKIWGDKLKAVNFTKNFGQHNAILCGFAFCKGEFVVTMDDDLQHPPEELLKLIEKQKQTDADIVYGMYAKKHHSSVRNFGSMFVRKTSDNRSHNKGAGSSFRLIKHDLAKIMVEKHSTHFLFLDAVLAWHTGNVETTAVEHHQRKAGKTGYSFSKLLSIYIDILYYYSTKPLKVITVGGLFFSIVTFLFGLRFIYNKIVNDVPLGYTSIIVSILFSTSLILLCLGIIGNYLYKLYQLQQNKPPYSIKNTI